MDTKTKTIIYNGLGFPIQLIDCPYKKIDDEWMMDINLIALQRFVFQCLLHKPHTLAGKELKFMRKFLGLSTTELGKKLGVTHSAIIQWEKDGKTKISKAQEPYIRLVLCGLFQEKEVIRIFKEIRPDTLAKQPKEEMFQIDVKALKVENF